MMQAKYGQRSDNQRGRGTTQDLCEPIIVDHRLIRHPRHDPPRGDGIGQRVDAVDSDRTTVGLEQAGDQSQRGCLARTVRSEQREEFSGGNTEIQPIHRRVIEALFERADFEGKR